MIDDLRFDSGDQQVVLNGVDTGFELFQRLAGLEADFLRGKHRAIVDAFIGDQVDHHAAVVDLAALSSLAT